MSEEKLKGSCLLKLNSIEKIENDPTLLKSTWIILDYNESGNGDVVTQELALSAAPTLKSKPLLLKYFPVSEPNTSTDHLGSHEVYVGTNRYGEEVLMTNTIAVGVAESEGYETSIIDENNNEVKVLACDFVLWYSRYSDPCDLLLEWNTRGIPIYSSCEYLFYNYEVTDGVRHINFPLVFDGHCILNSEERGGSKVISPAYTSSKLISFNEKQKWNKAISKAITNQKEVDGVSDKMFKKICELSFGDVYSLIYDQLMKILSENEYDCSWITDVYETYFILSYRNENERKYYKVGYTKIEDVISIDWDNRKEVFLYEEWREIPEVQTKLNELNIKINELTTQINSTNETLNTVTVEKDGIAKQFNEATEKLTSLNSQVEELTPFREKYETEQFEKKLNEKKEYYLGKFEAVNNKEKFESEEIQNLVKLSVNENEEGKNAILQLNTMLVEMVQPVVKNENAGIKEFASKQENLIPTGTDFDSRYKS